MRRCSSTFFCHPTPSAGLIKSRTRRTQWRRTASALWLTGWFRSRSIPCTQTSPWRLENHRRGRSRAKRSRRGVRQVHAHLDRCWESEEDIWSTCHVLTTLFFFFFFFFSLSQFQDFVFYLPFGVAGGLAPLPGNDRRIKERGSKISNIKADS